MGVVNLKSTSVTNADATPPVQNKQGFDGGRIRRKLGKASITSGDSSTSTYRLFRISSGDTIDKLFISCPDIGTTTVCSIGLYDEPRINGGAVVDVDFFGASISLKDGALANSDVTHGNVITLANTEKKVWEQLGLNEDPRKLYDVAITLTADADGTGVLAARLMYVDGN
ncbi:hypothetical protein [Arenimonas sp.]|uniref:hypothetical protein n=1 Tax=Arenimonas sp. TaxID=1872635 RepID=UPI0039E6177B